MRRPSPGVTVTAIVGVPGGPEDDVVVTVLGNVVHGEQWDLRKSHVLWEPAAQRDFRLTLLAEDEGVMWAYGGGKEVEGALLAAYRLR